MKNLLRKLLLPQNWVQHQSEAGCQAKNTDSLYLLRLVLSAKLKVNIVSAGCRRFTTIILASRQEFEIYCSELALRKVFYRVNRLLFAWSTHKNAFQVRNQKVEHLCRQSTSSAQSMAKFVWFSWEKFIHRSEKMFTTSSERPRSTFFFHISRPEKRWTSHVVCGLLD